MSIATEQQLADVLNDPALTDEIKDWLHSKRDTFVVGTLGNADDCCLSRFLRSEKGAEECSVFLAFRVDSDAHVGTYAGSVSCLVDGERISAPLPTILHFFEQSLDESVTVSIKEGIECITAFAATQVLERVLSNSEYTTFTEESQCHSSHSSANLLNQ